jgi:hypothetical protein
MPGSSRIELVCPLCKGKFTEPLAEVKRAPALVCPMCGTLLGKVALTKAINDAQRLLRLRRLLRI